MYKYETMLVEQAVAVATICDACGKDSGTGTLWAENASNMMVILEKDDQEWQADLCPECWNEVIGMIRSKGGNIKPQ